MSPDFFNEEAKEYLSDNITRLMDRSSRHIRKEYFHTLDKKDISYYEDDLFALALLRKRRTKMKKRDKTRSMKPQSPIGESYSNNCRV